MRLLFIINVSLESEGRLAAVSFCKSLEGEVFRKNVLKIILCHGALFKTHINATTLKTNNHENVKNGDELQMLKLDTIDVAENNKTVSRMSLEMLKC